METHMKNTPFINLQDVKPIEFITSGVDEIDSITRGYPRGRITQIFGLAGVGKTTMLIKCLAKISNKNKALYCDVENAINIERVKELGATSKNISYNNDSILEVVCDHIRNNIGKFDVIILDSIAMLVPRSEYNSVVGDQSFVGLKPRLLGFWLRQIEGDLGHSKTALVLINQMRRSMELYGEKYVLPGGMQLKFSSSLMLQLNTTAKDRIIKNGVRVGHKIHVTVTKSKVSAPNLSTVFPLYY